MSWETYVQLAASLVTIAGMYFYGNKSVWGPWLGIAAQAPWWIIMVHGGLWGLLPVNIVMFVMHIRNLLKWRADAHRETLQAEGQQTGVVQRNRAQSHAPKAYQILSGGELR